MVKKQEVIEMIARIKVVVEIFCMIGLLIAAALILFFTYGCAGAKKTANEPLHAESGAGLTIWKIPVFGFGGWGDNNGKGAEIIVHKYDYQAKPPVNPQVPTMPAPTDYQTIYGSVFDDPTLVIFKNNSYRKVRIAIDEKSPIELGSYESTANLHLGIGEHRIRVIVEKPTAVHGIFTTERRFTIEIRPTGRSQIVYIYE